MINIDADSYGQLQGRARLGLEGDIIAALKADGSVSMTSTHPYRAYTDRFTLGRIAIYNHSLGMKVVRRRIPNGVEISVAPKRPSPLIIATWQLETKIHIIIEAEIMMVGKGELANPKTKPKLKCKLLLRDERGRKLRIVADWVDGKFVHHGTPLDALNADQVAEEITKKCVVG